MRLSPQKIDKAQRAFEAARKGTLWTPRNKLLAALALLYLVLPFDLLPDWVFPLIGWLDDLGVLSFAALWICSHRAAPPPPSQQEQQDDEP